MDTAMDMTSSGTRRRLPWLTLALAAAACAAVWAPGGAEGLEWLPGVASTGAPWRWLTCHLAHFSSEQTLLNVSALLLLGAAVETLAPRRMAWVLGLSALAIPAALELWAPDLPSYRGLSGLASGAFALLVVLLARRAWERGERPILGLVLGVGSLFVAKTAWEVLAGRAVFMDAGDAGFVVVPLAHAVAATVGLLVGCLDPGFRRPVSDRGNPAGKSQDLHTTHVTAPARPE